MKPLEKVYQDALIALNGRRLPDAERLFKKFLKKEPRHIGALNLLTVVLMSMERFADAEKYIAQAVKLHDKSDASFHNYGLISKRLGKLEQARDQFSNALKLNPAAFETWSSRGTVFNDLEQYELALADFDRAIALNPTYAEAFSNKGRSLAELKRSDEALAACERALALKPDLAEAWVGKANSLTATKRYEEALAACERAVALKPDLAEAWSAKSKLFAEIHYFDEALAACDQALAIKPQMAEFWLLRGQLSTDLADYDEAFRAYDKALELNVALATAHAYKGSALVQLGRLAEALEAFKRALAIDPSAAKFYVPLAEAEKFTPEDWRLALLEERAADGDRVSSTDRLNLDFALGKAYADLGEHQRAFEHLLRGNRLKRAEIDYDEAAALGEIDRIETVFSPELVAAKGGGGDPSSVPVFILGMPRSGSTLIEQILAGHPRVHAAGELPIFNDILNPSLGSDPPWVPYPEAIANLNRSEIHQIGSNYMTGLFRRAPPAARVTDKMPHNFMYAGIIHLALPNAKIIHTVRNPIDTCISCFSKLFLEPLNFTYDLAELGRYHRRYQRLMAHWHRVLPAGSILDVRYEDVVADIESQTRRILEYCGLEWDERCLAFYENKRPVRTASFIQVRQPIYSNSVSRWRVYEEYLGPLLAELNLAESVENR